MMSPANSSALQTALPYRTKLRDGTPVLFRQINPEDKSLLEVGMKQLSSQDRYFRFFQPMSTLSVAMLRRFTELDHYDHEAIGALDVSELPASPVGIARYVRSSEDDTVAEVAITVASGYQQRGVGTLLLAVLANQAVLNDIREFSALVLHNNTKMLKLFDELQPSSKIPADGAVSLRIPLHRNPRDYPKTTVGNVFKQVQEQSMEVA